LKRLTKLRRALECLRDPGLVTEQTAGTALTYYAAVRAWALAGPHRAYRTATPWAWQSSLHLENTFGDRAAVSRGPADAPGQQSHMLLFEVAAAGLCAFYTLWTAAYGVSLTNFLRPDVRSHWLSEGCHDRARSLYKLAYQVLAGVWRDAVGPAYEVTALWVWAEDRLPELQREAFWALMCMAAGCAGLAGYNAFELVWPTTLHNLDAEELVELDAIERGLQTQRTAYAALAWSAHVFGCGVRWLQQTALAHSQIYSALVALRRTTAAKALMRASIYLSRYAVYLKVLGGSLYSDDSNDVRATLCFVRHGTKAAHLALVASCLCVDSQALVALPQCAKLREEAMGEHEHNVVANYKVIVERNQMVAGQNLAHEHMGECGVEMPLACTMQFLPQYYLNVVGLCQPAAPFRSWRL
jgi:hypothetical protein